MAAGALSLWMALPDVAPQPRPSVDHQYRGARSVLRALERLSPQVAARVAEALFVRTVRARQRPDEVRWLLEARRESLAVHGRRIVVYEWGPPTAPLVLCCHGWWSHAGRFVAIAQPILAAGQRVAAFDAPGHGASSGWRASMPEFARTLRAVADHVGTPHAIVGHSLGGAATIYALFQGLSADRAVVVAAPANLAVWADRFRDALDLSPQVDTRMRARLSERLNFAWSELELTRLVGQLDQPGLVIHDRDDGDVPVTEGRLLAAHWPGAELVETSGLGHRKILRDPEVIARVAEFVGTGR